jgi:hypothetical protein
MTALVTLLGALLLQGAAPGQVAVQRGVAVVPESVTVGDPFRVVVRVRAPRGAVVEFPTAPDSGTGVEPLDPAVMVPSTDTTLVEQTATYRLAAWDVGHLPIRFPEILIRLDGTTRRLAVGRDLAIIVTSVLPADSAQRVPKPPRALFVFGPPWWWWFLVALAAALIIGLLWWWWRRRRRRPAEVLDPWALAQQEFQRVDALELVASGERGRHVTLVIEVLRLYLSRVAPSARTSLTTSELALALRQEGRVPMVRLLRLLHEVDLVKFAGQGVEAARAREVGVEARALVEAVQASLTAPVARRAA